MSDRVAIIGGSTVGRDHFPYPPFLSLTPGSPLPKPDYPIAFTPAEYCKMFYVVRKWRLELSVAWTNAVGSGSGDVSLIWEPKIIPFEAVPPYQMTRESEIVLTRNVGDFIWSQDHGYEPSEEIIITDESFSGDVFNGYAIEFTYDQPFFYAEALFCRFAVTVDSDGEFGCSTFPLTGYTETVGQFTLTGFTPTAPILAHALTGGHGVTSCDATVTPAEYWPYATKAGLPVYNTTTGAQLRDPFS